MYTKLSEWITVETQMFSTALLEDTCMTGRGLEVSVVVVVLAESQWKVSRFCTIARTLPAVSYVLIQPLTKTLKQSYPNQDVSHTFPNCLMEPSIFHCFIFVCRMMSDLLIDIYI